MTGMVRVNKIFTIISLHCHYHLKIFQDEKRLSIFIIFGYLLHVLRLVRGGNAQRNKNEKNLFEGHPDCIPANQAQMSFVIAQFQTLFVEV